MRRIAMAVSIFLIPATTLAAQQPVTPDGEMDVPDLIRAWRHKEPRLPASHAKRRSSLRRSSARIHPQGSSSAPPPRCRLPGDPSTTRITSGIASLSISTKKHVLLNVRFDSFSDGNRWLVKGDNRFQNTSQNIYGFGTATPESAAVNTDYGFVRVQETVYRHRAEASISAEGFSSTRIRAFNRRSLRIPTGPRLRTSLTASRTTCR